MKIAIQLAAVAAIYSLSTTAMAEGDAVSGDAANGENVFKKCKICHQIGDTAKNQVGPMLTGIIGRKAGIGEGFAYSPAMKEAGEKGTVWNEETLAKYMENPKDFIPKNKMAFVGLKAEKDRADVIAYLAKFPAK